VLALVVLTVACGAMLEASLLETGRAEAGLDEFISDSYVTGVKYAAVAIIVCCVLLILLAYTSGQIALALLAFAILAIAVVGAYFGTMIWKAGDDFDDGWQCQAVFPNVARKYLDFVDCGETLYLDRAANPLALDCPDYDLVLETQDTVACMDP
jgi:hypothetical protein